MRAFRTKFTSASVGSGISPAVLALLSLLVCAGCGHPGRDVEITQRRISSNIPRNARVGMSTAERFGQSPMGAPRQQMESTAVDDSLHFELPKGWKELAPTSMRLLNLQPAGNADASCYVSVLGGDGGGLAANLNRWRKQMGLEPATEEELAALPKVNLFGGEATLIELRGSFAGMDGSAQSGWGLLGAVASTPQATLFVKMTAPVEILEQEHDAFLDFLDSLQFGQHGEHQHQAQAAPDNGEESAPAMDGAGAEKITQNGYRFQLPAGWTDAGPKTMRTLNFRVGKETECYLVVLSGDGGGTAANLNRWQAQMGLEPLSEEEIAALPRVPMLHKQAPLLLAEGDYVGMGGTPSMDMALLGVALELGDHALFLKMVGPDKEVASQRTAFISFLASLEEVQ